MQIFEGRIYFAVFADNVWSTKINSSKFTIIICSIDIMLCQNPVILENKIAKMLNLWRQRNIRTSTAQNVPRRKSFAFFAHCELIAKLLRRKMAQFVFINFKHFKCNTAKRFRRNIRMYIQYAKLPLRGTFCEIWWRYEVYVINYL